MLLTRRQFLRRSAAASAALLIPNTLELLAARAAAGATGLAQGYGPLIPDPAGLLDLPRNFQYRAFSTALLGNEVSSRFSQRLSDGDLVPALHDGMAAFEGPEGMTVLVRNHEVDPTQFPACAPGKEPRYDAVGRGGTTTLWVDADRNLVRAFPSLAGTFRNCAGGRTPWGTWLSCEECTYTPGPAHEERFDQRADVNERHGYVFEVDARAEALVPPVPIKAMGRFYHEAIAVDPATGFVYLTEDRTDGLLYRYRPSIVTSGHKHPSQLAVGDLASGGVLEALRIVGRPSARTQNRDPAAPQFKIGQSHGVDWVAIPEIEPDVDMERDPTDTDAEPLKRRARTAATSTRAQGFGLGAAQFARQEGITYHRGAVYVCMTNGGSAKLGQVWRLELKSNRLSLLAEPNDGAQLDGPDNITPAPNGDLIVCEDGKGEDFLVGVTPHGTLYHLARNAYNETEFAGCTFAPDGRTLFVNIQDPGITFAIWGPWEKCSV